MARADAPQQTNANPLTWFVVFRYDIGDGPQHTDTTIVCQPNGTIQTSEVNRLPGWVNLHDSVLDTTLKAEGCRTRLVK